MPEELFYIQNVGFAGNCLKFWRPEGRGYTSDLNEAWKVTAEKAKQICRSRPNEDIPRLVSRLDKIAARHVDCEAFWQSEREASKICRGCSSGSHETPTDEHCTCPCHIRCNCPACADAEPYIPVGRSAERGGWGER